ncbi:0f4f9e58-43b1-4d5e-a64a-1ae6a9e2dadc [Thermothielavioides terrestris]|uniref:0f4f9e58-43b1-4d5e-a64a-1ae6a9e2dadc n=1 Tax=Thermothielavioides terrestris TaxID=2587410 RepID=A0A446B6Z5_9PEZI|nr:0f4f9e58-43b1-4d5e-a64a-1ae6a9e2dadc [Thermothielavioides terrestris]
MVPSSRSSTSSAISRKPIPGSSTSTYDSLTSSAPTLTTATARTSEASESSSRFEADTASTPLSPDDQLSPLSDQGGSFESPAPKALQKAPPIPRSPPPAPPALLTEPGTPQRVPAVTATQATPDERSPSPDRPPAAAMLQPNRLQPRHPSPSPSPRGRIPSVVERIRSPLAREVPLGYGQAKIENELVSRRSVEGQLGC